MKNLNLKSKQTTLMITGIGVLLACAIYLGLQIKNDNIGIQVPMMVAKGDAKVTFVLGDAYYRNTAKKYSYWKQLILGSIVGAGYEIKTLANSKADISFSNQTVVRLEKNSLIHLAQFSAKTLELLLERGSLYGEFKKLLNTQEVKIQTPTVIAKMGSARIRLSTYQEERSKRMITNIYSLSGLSEITQIMGEGNRIFLSERQKTSIAEKGGSILVKQIGSSQAKELDDMFNSLHKDEVLVIAHNISFKKGSYEISIDSYPELNRILKILKKREAHIRIEGHTDSEGSVLYNQELSMKRAESIKMYLVDKGMDEDTLDVFGHGEARPISNNKMGKGRELNRRVEFSVLEEKEIQDEDIVQAGF